MTKLFEQDDSSSTDAIVLSLQSEASQNYWLQNNESEFTWICPPTEGMGYVQSMELRPGLSLDIYNYRLHEAEPSEDDRSPDRPHPLEYVFYLSDCSPNQGQYCLWGSGLAPAEVNPLTETTTFFQVNVHIEPEIFQAFIANAATGLPETLQHLVRPFDRQYYQRYGIATPTMQSALRQILLCPYGGLIKQLYLDGKVMELLALLLEQELEAQQGKNYVCALKPEEMEQIHFARQLLLQQLQQPPSIATLARQVGLNEHTLTKGFRQVFGQTVFGYLHEYRLEQARALVAIGDLKMAEIAALVGFASRSYFASAFRKKFGLSPKAYQLSYKKLR
jgi:AraC-like DNA-binding protein